MTGGYLLTQKEVFFDRARACQLIAAIMAQNDQNINIQLPPPAIIKVTQFHSSLAPGRQWSVFYRQTSQSVDMESIHTQHSHACAYFCW